VPVAGALLRRYSGKLLTVQAKRSAGIISEADLATEETICALLCDRHPNASSFTEEQGLPARKTDYARMADPLDSTRGIPRMQLSPDLRENSARRRLSALTDALLTA
jgi:fructose-1,6-bisphosphatase/inositol monophosphatase family enzyme